jgi:hypothetical protein
MLGPAKTGVKKAGSPQTLGSVAESFPSLFVVSCIAHHMRS